MAISTVNQKGLDAPLTLTSPVISNITSAAATALTLQSAGTTAITVDASQRVGIGTSSPSAPLQIQANSSGIAVRVQGRSSDGYGSLGYYNNAVTTLQGQVDVNNTGMYFGTTIATPIQFYTNDTERMRILSDGSILLGTTTQGGATGISFSNASDSALYGKSMYMNTPYNGTRNAISFAYNSAGGVGQIVTGTNSVSYQSGSDYRLKEDIAPMTGALATVAQLKPVTFKWKLDGSDGQGFIAHELQAVVPDCVTGEKDAVDAEGKPVYQGVDTSFLVATLTAAIQELKAEFDAYKASHP